MPKNARVGPGCFLERKASFQRYRSERPIGLSLGTNVKVYTWTEFNIDPDGAVTVGDDSALVGVVFMCAERITIGKRVVISYYVTIADSDFHPLDPEARRLDAIANAPCGDLSKRPRVESRPVEIEDDVWIGSSWKSGTDHRRDTRLTSLTPLPHECQTETMPVNRLLLSLRIS